MVHTQGKDEAECWMQARRQAARAQTVQSSESVSQSVRHFTVIGAILAQLTIPPWQMLLLQAPTVDHLGVDTA